MLTIRILYLSTRIILTVEIMMASHFFRRLPLKSTITQFTYSKPYSPIVSIKFRISSFHTASTVLSEEDVNFRNIDLTKVTIDSSRANVAPSSLDREKELFALKRALSAQYSKGNYEMALRIAVDLLDKTEKLYGKKNPVYASCLNNIALMVNSLNMTFVFREIHFLFD